MKICISIERWKFNKEYGLYVSNKGNVKNRNKQELKPKVNGSGYLMVKSIKGKYISIHRLVMMTFRPIYDDAKLKEMTVDHLNHNKRDNTVKNLEWVTVSENLRRAKLDMIKGKADLNEDEELYYKVIRDRFKIKFKDMIFNDFYEAVEYLILVNPNTMDNKFKDRYVNRIISAVKTGKNYQEGKWSIINTEAVAREALSGASARRDV